MSNLAETPSGDRSRQAIDSLRGYVYQIYQSALAWTELASDEFLFLEVAEDYAVAAENALNAIQVKDTSHHVTINSDDIVASINSFVKLQKNNPKVTVSLRHLTTSQIGKEKDPKHRVDEKPTLVAWRSLAKAGDLSGLRKVLENSKLSKESKSYIANLDDNDLREKFLKKIHFDCGAPESQFLSRQLLSRVSELVLKRGGVHSEAVRCTAEIMFALLRLATTREPEERFVDKNDLEEHLETATKITLSRAQFEANNKLMMKALSASVAPGSDLASSQAIKPNFVSKIPLPKALADRKECIMPLQKSLETAGIGWIAGAAGMGKTLTTRLLADKNEGVWASINLRDKTKEQAESILFDAANALPRWGLKGLIIDDLDCSLGPSLLDNFRCLFHTADRSDVLLLVTSSNQPPNELLFEFGIQSEITITLSEFTQKDIEEILAKLGVRKKIWANYAYIVSGGGHPQLAIAFIQSMNASGWASKELETYDALLAGSPAVEEVRRRTRERLLKDLPEASRRLLERLSLKAGGFHRELAIDLGKVEPMIQDAGLVLDRLIGAWIDQHASDRFSLSPLLYDFASKTLTSAEIKAIQSAIANSLTKGGRVDLVDMNAALMAAWSSHNQVAFLKLCLSVIASDLDDVEVIAPNLPMITLFRTDTVAYPDNAVLSHTFRGAQLLLLNQDTDSQSKLEDVLQCFSNEARNVESEALRNMMNVLIYSKLLLQTSKAGLGVRFLSIIRKLDKLLCNEGGTLPQEMLEGVGSLGKTGVSPVGFLFINQVRQLSRIEDLLDVFEFLDSSSTEQRERLLAPFERDDLQIDMLVTGAFLSEHENNSIDPAKHSEIFSALEQQAASWDRTDIAVCCRKHWCIILDEYGDDSESALAVLDEGLVLYGRTNSELVRAKAKVLYRSEDHASSLALSKQLIESNAPLNDIEKVFLARDAAISAEKQSEYETARHYYLYGSAAAGESEIPDMAALRVGLLADAALASWHHGDQRTCLQDFVVVLKELNKLPVDETLRTVHCQAVARHVLLWLHQEVTGYVHVTEDGEETRVYPGCVSNPEPHPKIGQRYISPIEMAWYMLASVENYAAIDAGITENLEQLLPNGPVLEGQLLLSPAKIHKAMLRLDVGLFLAGLKSTISYFAYMRASGERLGGFDIKKVTYGTFPLATREQQEELVDLTEQFILVYCAMCILKRDAKSFSDVVKDLPVAKGYYVRQVILDLLQGSGSVEDYYSSFAKLISTHATQEASPRQVFDLAFKSLETSKATGTSRIVSEALLLWLQRKWKFIRKHQRFLLKHPSLHESAIDAAVKGEYDSALEKVAGILMAILPALDIANQEEVKQCLVDLPRN